MTIKRGIAFILVIVLVVVAIFIFKDKKNKDSLVLPSSTPSAEEQIEEKFSGLIISDDEDKIELENVSDGEGIGVATKNGVYADLPDLDGGETYQVKIGNGLRVVSLGYLQKAKGGWILEYDLSKYEGYYQIFVLKGSEQILKGEF